MSASKNVDAADILKHDLKTRTLLDSLAEFVIYYDREMRILWANAAALRSTDMQLEELTQKRCWAVWSQRNEMCEDCVVYLAMTTDQPQSIEKETPDGRSWIVNGYPVKNDAGAVIGGIETCIEITQKVAAQRKLKSAYDILSRSPAAGFEWRNAPGWPVRFVTPNVSQIFGYSAEEFIRGDIKYDSVVAPQDLKRVAQEVANNSADLNCREFTHAPYRIVTKDGTIKWVSDRTVIDRDKNGQVLFYKGIIEDISDKVRAEAALNAEKERLRITLRSIGDAVIATDRKGRITLMNPIAEDLTGWNESSANGKPLNEVFRIVNELTREPCPSPVDEVIRTGKTVNLANHTMLISRDGTEHIIADSGSPILDEDQKITGIVLVFRDITHAQRVEAELLKMEKLNSLGVLAGGIAHDFNNFLTGIMGNISLAKLDLEPNHEIYTRLNEMEKAAVHAKDLTQQLLTFSKGGQPVKHTVKLDRLVREAALFAVRGSNVRCEFEFADDLWLSQIDEGQVAQVIHNLVLNADQAMPAGGVINISAENKTLMSDHHLALPSGQYVKLALQDQGSGIQKEHLKKVFDPYFSTKQKGSGLGLAIVYSIIEKHDGQVTVYSELGIGTTFNIYLPAASGGTPESEVEHKVIVTGSGRVLVMDDEEIIRALASQILKKLGYESTLAKNGAEALERYREAQQAGRPFNAVILDLTVPGGKGGKETIKDLLQIDPHVKAIVSSGYSNDSVIANFSEYGFKAAVKKPYLVTELNDVLNSLLNPDT